MAHSNKKKWGNSIKGGILIDLNEIKIRWNNEKFNVTWKYVVLGINLLIEINKKKYEVIALNRYLFLRF